MIENLTHENLKTVEQLLNARDGAEQPFDLAANSLTELVEAGQLSQCNELADAASLLVNMCELAKQATDCDEAALARNEIVEFVRKYLPTIQSILDGGQDGNGCVEQMSSEAMEKWGDCLALFASKANTQPTDSDWKEAAWADSKSLSDARGICELSDESSATIDDSDAQIAMLLAALDPSAGDTAVGPQQNDVVTSEQAPINPDTFASSAGAHDSLEIMRDRDLLEAYLDDAYRCLESMEQSVLALENSTGDTQPLHQFCRELHTLKGASASVGLSKLATYLHEVESAAELWTADGCDDEVQIDSLLQAVDAVRAQVTALTQQPGISIAGEEQEPVRPSIEQSPPRETPRKKKPRRENRHAEPVAFQTATETSIRIRASKLDRLMDMLAELVVLRNRRENHVNEMNQLNDELSRCATRLQFAEDQPETHKPADLENLIAYSGSNTLAEVAKDITEISRDLRVLHKPVSADNQAISQFIRHFRQELMQLRRLPISGLFKRLQRAARDAANSEEKQVQVKVSGENNGLEQELQEQLYEPLLHLIRNAVSHGIESSERRTTVGKSSVGSITLEAKSSANLLVIEVRDDGGGINFEAVRRRAIERGLLGADYQASKHELSQLIFHPGFSTRDEATEVSGRGFGMDIVATTVSQMHGRIEVDSTPGQGTTMRLLIPLRSGIEHVMVFRANGQLFALPMQSVNAARSRTTAHRDVLQVSLANLLSLPDMNSPQDDNVLILRRTIGLMNAKHSNVNQHVETSGGQSRFALTVDEVVGPEEVVVRSLPGLVQRHPLFCGVTLSGAGEMVLLLNSEKLGQACLQTFAESQRTQSCEASPGHFESDKRPLALVVEDSLSARKSLVKKLLPYGFAITEAGDGLEALDQLRRKKFALVLTDLDMPRLGGLELLSDIQTGHYGSAPVVVVSSRNEDEFRSRALDSGAAAYLNKPVTDESLANLLANLGLELTHSF